MVVRTAVGDVGMVRAAAGDEEGRDNQEDTVDEAAQVGVIEEVPSHCVQYVAVSIAEVVVVVARSSVRGGAVHSTDQH